MGIFGALGKALGGSVGGAAKGMASGVTGGLGKMAGGMAGGMAKAGPVMGAGAVKPPSMKRTSKVRSFGRSMGSR